jgi:hypothetical protein
MPDADCRIWFERHFRSRSARRPRTAADALSALSFASLAIAIDDGCWAAAGEQARYQATDNNGAQAGADEPSPAMAAVRPATHLIRVFSRAGLGFFGDNLCPSIFMDFSKLLLTLHCSRLCFLQLSLLTPLRRACAQ